MNNLQRKKKAFISIITKPLGFLKTVAGTLPLSLPYAFENNIKNYSIEGVSLQDGTPSPDNPIEIKSVGEKTVNLLPFPFTTPPNVQSSFTSPISKNGVTYTPNNDGSITIDGTSTAAFSLYLWANKTSLLPGAKVGDTITISKNPDDVSQHANVYFTCNYYKADGSMAQGAVSSSLPSSTKTITEDWVGICVYIHVPNGRTINNLTIKPQVQIGSTATPYEPYGKYKLDVVNRGVNLFDVDSITEMRNSNGTIAPQWKKEGDELIVDRTRHGGGIYFPCNITHLKSGVYTITVSVCNPNHTSDTIYMGCKTISNSDVIKSYDVTYINTWATISVSFEITTDTDIVGIILQGGSSENYNDRNVHFKNVQLEYGGVSTDYEPYREPITTPIFLDEPLRGIGDYKDKIDFESGMVERKIKTLGDLSSYSWTKNTEYLDYASFYLACSVVGMSLVNEGVVLSNNFQNAKWSNVQSTEGNYVWKATSSFGFRLHKDYMPGYDELTSAKQLQAFKDWLTTNNITIQYPLNEPISEQLTLPKLPLFEGTNILTIEGDIQPEMTISYMSRIY